jgi:hypothetical protein
MKAQIMDGEVVAWGKLLHSEGVILVDCPFDYIPEKYNYIDGEFVIREDWIEPQPSIDIDV